VRVLIVDDSAVVRQLMTKALDGVDGITVVGTAPNGEIALEKIGRLEPDVVTLDLEMPVMDGLQTLEALRERGSEVPVIVVSALTEQGARTSIEALTRGARDYVTKPAKVSDREEAITQVREALAAKVMALAGQPPKVASKVSAPPAPHRVRPASGVPVEVIAIGISTGGPNALDVLVPALPGDLPVPVLIVQHMPPVFTAQLANRLDRHCKLDVEEGCDGALVQAGHVYIAPGGLHMVVKRAGTEVRIETNEEPPENSCRPAVDPLFRSVTDVYGAGTLAVVMTGMGSDGLRGCESVHQAGGRILVQDEASSVVWGMPGYVANAGLADAQYPLDQLAAAIAHAVVAG